MSLQVDWKEMNEIINWSVTDHGHYMTFQSSTATLRSTDPQTFFERAFLSDPAIAVAGAKRLDSTGKLFSMGEFVVHPKGFHHLYEGIEGNRSRFALEVDGFAGGLVAIQTSWLENIGWDKESFEGNFALLDLCLRIRKANGRCVTLPHVVVEDEYELTEDHHGVENFNRHWGFDLFIPDMDAIFERYQKTGLLWNTRLHMGQMPFEKYDNSPAYHWSWYRQSPQKYDYLVSVVAKLGQNGRALDMGCGDGIYTHLIAKSGLNAFGVELEESAVRQAFEKTSQESYPSCPPRFLQGSACETPFQNESFNVIAAFDVIEHVFNPAKLLGEIERLLVPGGAAVIVTPFFVYEHGLKGKDHHVDEYTKEELRRQVDHCGRLQTVEAIEIPPDMLLIAIKS